MTIKQDFMNIVTLALAMAWRQANAPWRKRKQRK
jgi:hypothetical protein